MQCALRTVQPTNQPTSKSKFKQFERQERERETCGNIGDKDKEKEPHTFNNVNNNQTKM